MLIQVVHNEKGVELEMVFHLPYYKTHELLNQKLVEE